MKKGIPILILVLALVGAGLWLVRARQRHSPVENLPSWLQDIDWFNPLRHFIIIVKGVFLKDVGVRELLHPLWPLIVIAVITLGSANWMFRRRLGQGLA